MLIAYEQQCSLLDNHANAFIHKLLKIKWLCTKMFLALGWLACHQIKVIQTGNPVQRNDSALLAKYISIGHKL